MQKQERLNLRQGVIRDQAVVALKQQQRKEHQQENFPVQSVQENQVCAIFSLCFLTRLFHSMALFDDEESSYEASSYGGHYQGRGNLLSEYDILHSHSFGNLYVFKEICNDFYTDLVEGDMERKSQYLGFTHVRMRDIQNIDEIRSEVPKMTILYDSHEEILIVKFMAGVTHEICASLLQKSFDRVVQDRTGDFYSVIVMKSARFEGVNRMKEADEAFKPRSRVLATDWPSIAFEVGVSEWLTQLQQDAHFWLECSEGQTRIVIIASVDTTTRSMVIQRWQGGPRLEPAPQCQPSQNMSVFNLNSQNSFPTLIQSLTLQEGQVYVGASLTIPADLIYDVLPLTQGAPFGSSDFEITSQMLNSLNDVFWSVLL